MMRYTIFCHSLVSDWNHGNAHFLRGICTALQRRGHQVAVYEPRNGWSAAGLRGDYGDAPFQAFHEDFPHLRSTEYDLAEIDLNEALRDADVVLVHEWNPAELVRRIGQHRAATGGYRLLFHDTHHRSLTAPQEMANYDLTHYDGVLAFGESIRCRYLSNKWVERAWTWHEAADTSIFFPREPKPDAPRYDLVWIGNWGDDERANELREFLIDPVKELGLRACVFGVRYPEHALRALCDAGIEYGGWLPNARVPEIFAQAHCTIHIPRRPYARALTGVPTIRMFEALACRIPLISAPWWDKECLFRPGRDFIFAADGAEMKRRIRSVLADPAAWAHRAQQGFNSIRARHTCEHRAGELEAIGEGLK